MDHQAEWKILLPRYRASGVVPTVEHGMLEVENRLPACYHSNKDDLPELTARHERLRKWMEEVYIPGKNARVLDAALPIDV